MDPVHYSAPTCVSHNGFLFKTASMARAITERKAREGNLLTLAYNKVGILCVVNLHLCPPCRVQSSLVYSEWWHLQLLWEWQELEPQRSSESFRDSLLGCRTAWETWVRAYKQKLANWLFSVVLLFFHPLTLFLITFFLTLRYDHTFELYIESERLYLFGTDDPDSHKEWVKSIAKVTTKYTLQSGITSTNSSPFSSDLTEGRFDMVMLFFL